MTPNVILILQTQLNQETFLTVCSEMLGHSPARKADNAGLSGVPHLVSTLAAFNDSLESDVYDILQFGYLIVADERDTSEILEVASGMPVALVNTILRGTQAILISGSLRQWIVAVARGCRKEQETSIRTCYDKIYLSFCHQGLASIFAGTKHELPDRTFYLTYDKRK